MWVAKAWSTIHMGLCDFWLQLRELCAWVPFLPKMSCSRKLACWVEELPFNFPLSASFLCTRSYGEAFLHAIFHCPPCILKLRDPRECCAILFLKVQTGFWVSTASSRGTSSLGLGVLSFVCIADQAARSLEVLGTLLKIEKNAAVCRDFPLIDVVLSWWFCTAALMLSLSLN